MILAQPNIIKVPKIWPDNRYSSSSETGVIGVVHRMGLEDIGPQGSSIDHGPMFCICLLY